MTQTSSLASPAAPGRRPLAPRADRKRAGGWIARGRSRASGWEAVFRLVPLAVLTFALLLPPEMRVNLADQNLYAYRIAYLFFLPWAIYSIGKGALRLQLIDGLVLAAGIWMTLSFVMLYGVEDGLASGVAVALDAIIPYLIARLTIRTVNDFRRYLIVVLPLFALLAILMPVEAISHQRFIREAAIGTFGSLTDVPFGIKNDLRWGMLRAMGPFSHQILAGLFYCTILALFYYSRLRGWPYVVGVVSGLAGFFSLSSATVLSLAIFVILAIYEKLVRLVSFLTWPLFVIVVFAALATVQIITDSGLIRILIRLTFRPQTGYYRLLIWEYGSATVAKFPVFGIGYRDWERLSWMTSSVDTFWLATAMRNGLPPAVLLFAATVLVMIGLALKSKGGEKNDQATRFGLLVALLIMLIQGFTTSFFGGTLIWFGVLLGIGSTFAFAHRAKPAGRRVTLWLKPQ